MVVYNNVDRAAPAHAGSLVEASMDLGADGWQTFRYVTFPASDRARRGRAARVRAVVRRDRRDELHLRARELTLPKFIFNNLRLPRNRPVVNVVALVVVVLSIHPRVLRAAAGRER